MEYLRKIWIRVIVSLVSGGLLMELFHITTGDPNRPREANFTLLFAAIIFGLIGFYIRVVDWKKSKGGD
jgi:hypothetical protein